MKRALLVGVGGWAREHWIDLVWPDFRDRVTIAGLIDSDERALHEAANILGTPKELCFLNMSEGFARTEADFCVIVVPPHIHKEAVLLAVDHDMHILSEKPLADTFDDYIAVARAVSGTPLKMAITQNYRYEAPIMTFQQVLRSNELGRIDYMVGRYASDYRQPGSWDVGDVHTMDDPLLREASIHHFDMLRHFCGANCQSIKGFNWNPAWSSFQGNSSALCLLEMENGVKALYEGNSSESGSINRWHQEYYRVECEKGSVVLGNDRVVRVHTRDKKGKLHFEEVPHVAASPTGHHSILSNFLSWLDGTGRVDTDLADNINSMAIVFAAIDAARDGSTKLIADYLPQ